MNTRLQQITKYTKMLQKTVIISLPEKDMSMEKFKNSLGIFKVKRVHIEDSDAFVQFKDGKELQAFQFTNSNKCIRNLQNAKYDLVDSSFKWTFLPNQCCRLNDLKDEQRDQTEPDSDDNSSSKQTKQIKEQIKHQVMEFPKFDERLRQREIQKNLRDLRINLRLQKIKQQRERRLYNQNLKCVTILNEKITELAPQEPEQKLMQEPLRNEEPIELQNGKQEEQAWSPKKVKQSIQTVRELSAAKPRRKQMNYNAWMLFVLMFIAALILAR